jgi:predicted Zn-dependent protease
MEQKIRLYEKESSQIKEALAQKTNFDLIRQQAISRLGLQDPARAQLVKVHIPETDRIVYARQGVAGTDDAVWLAGVYTTIEGYFKTINIGEPGD